MERLNKQEQVGADWLVVKWLSNYTWTSKIIRAAVVRWFFSECAPNPLPRLTKQKQIHIKYTINIHSALSLLFDTFHWGRQQSAQNTPKYQYSHIWYLLAANNYMLLTLYSVEEFTWNLLWPISQTCPIIFYWYLSWVVVATIKLFRLLTISFHPKASQQFPQLSHIWQHSATAVPLRTLLLSYWVHVKPTQQLLKLSLIHWLKYLGFPRNTHIISVTGVTVIQEHLPENKFINFYLRSIRTSKYLIKYLNPLAKPMVLVIFQKTPKTILHREMVIWTKIIPVKTSLTSKKHWFCTNHQNPTQTTLRVEGAFIHSNQYQEPFEVHITLKPKIRVVS